MNLNCEFQPKSWENKTEYLRFGKCSKLHNVMRAADKGAETLAPVNTPLPKPIFLLGSRFYSFMPSLSLFTHVNKKNWRDESCFHKNTFHAHLLIRRCCFKNNAMRLSSFIIIKFNAAYYFFDILISKHHRHNFQHPFSLAPFITTTYNVTSRRRYQDTFHKTWECLWTCLVERNDTDMSEGEEDESQRYSYR